MPIGIEKDLVWFNTQFKKLIHEGGQILLQCLKKTVVWILKTNGWWWWGSTSILLTWIFSREFFRINSLATSIQFQAMASLSNAVRSALRICLSISYCEAFRFFLVGSAAGGLSFSCFFLCISLCATSFRSISLYRAVTVHVRVERSLFIGSTYLGRYCGKSFRRNLYPFSGRRCWCPNGQRAADKTSRIYRQSLSRFRRRGLIRSFCPNHHHSRELFGDPLSVSFCVFRRFYPTFEQKLIDRISCS